MKVAPPTEIVADALRLFLSKLSTVDRRKLRTTGVRDEPTGGGGPVRIVDELVEVGLQGLSCGMVDEFLQVR